MTAQFREGDEVEVEGAYGDVAGRWRKAKIVPPMSFNSRYRVQFHDGSRAVFDVEHIRLSKEQVEQELIKNGERFLNTMGDEVLP